MIGVLGLKVVQLRGNTAAAAVVSVGSEFRGVSSLHPDWSRLVVKIHAVCHFRLFFFFAFIL